MVVNTDGIADGTGCGLGQGEQCCAYLMAGDLGLECGRDTPYRPIILQRVRDGLFTASRTPTADWPRCKLERLPQALPPGDPDPCPVCAGAGLVNVEGTNVPLVDMVCTGCDGTGR